jgi:hypothetical protein
MADLDCCEKPRLIDVPDGEGNPLANVLRCAACVQVYHVCGCTACKRLRPIRHASEDQRCAECRAAGIFNTSLCPVCGEPVITTRGRRIYCGLGCRAKAAKQRHAKDRKMA